MNCQGCATPVAEGARFCPSCGKETRPSETAYGTELPRQVDMIGRAIAGRYRILAKLGEGGMGAVYRGEQMSLKRAVAVKLLRPELSADPMLLRRFNAEAEVVAKLGHPNTVNIYDFGQDSDGSLFIAMEFIEGRSLRNALYKDGPMPVRRALVIAQQVAASLADAHSHSIIHRDLKPDNVMLQERGRQRDVARVLDFGIAKLRDDSRATQQAMTQAGDMLGTPQYMAPEQIKGEPIDGRTDVYALGCMIYEMVTGRMPFEAPTVMALLSKHLLEQAVAPTVRRPDLGLPPAIDRLVLGAMMKDPRARPPTMDVYGEQIAAVLAELPADPNRSGATPVSAIQAAPSPPPPTPAPYDSPPPLGAPSSVPAPVGAAPSYVPHQGPTPPAPRARSRTLWIGVVVVAVLGGGIAIFAATRSHGAGAGAGTPVPVPVPVPPPLPNDPWASQPGTGSGYDYSQLSPPPPPQPKPQAAPPPPVPTAPSTPDGTTVDVDGVKLILPPGFSYSWSNNVMYAANPSLQLTITAGPLLISSNDTMTLARDYAHRTGLALDGAKLIPINGVMRPASALHGKLNGVAIAQAAIAFIGRGYRVGVVFTVPIEQSTNAILKDWADQFLAQRVIVP